MATTVRWQRRELAGGTYTLDLQALGSGTTANTGGDDLTESGVGLFTATVDESLSGWHKAWMLDADEEVAADGWVRMVPGQTVDVRDYLPLGFTGGI